MDAESEGSLTIYLREIGKTPLLTPAEEIELAAIIKRGKLTEKKLASARLLSRSRTALKVMEAKPAKPVKSKRSKADSMMVFLQEAEAARQRMIRSNLRLVVKIAQDYTNYGLPLIDLVSEGNIGLMKAVERFDPSKGGKLSTYSSWWIKQSIKRALANQSKTIRLPVHLVDKISKMRKASMRLSEDLGREPTDEELAEELGMPVGKVARLRTAGIRPASLDAPVSPEDDSTELGDIIKDESALNPYELLRSKQLRGDIQELLDILEPREREIINFRFGMDGSDEKTLEEVGKKFRITRERVRQIQNIALTKMMKMMSKKDRKFVSIE
ncbi:MAG: sigma-70 family RNA polymerase sigma factor [Verrucomicrobiae bacterium]|nr:sigma-70 family RNA polymerase sigma factor [Verrucomicrobiae bacterium]